MSKSPSTSVDANFTAFLITFWVAASAAILINCFNVTATTAPELQLYYTLLSFFYAPVAGLVLASLILCFLGLAVLAIIAIISVADLIFG